MDLKTFIRKNTANKSNKQEKFPLGKIPGAQAKEVSEKTGVDVTGFERYVENFGLFHALSHHGNAKQEEARGQLAVTPADFEKIPEILKDPDRITSLGKSKRGGIVVQYTKRIGEQFFYGEELRTGKKEAVTKTMHKRK
jgi:hypothetical protein